MFTSKIAFGFGLSAMAMVLAGATARADDAGSATPERIRGMPEGRPYSPYADRNFPARPLFGDTHLHTMLSLDAGAFGARLSPTDAYRFARGEQVTASSGQPVRLSRPLDFLVVADHSDNMGLFTDLLAGAPNIVSNPQGQRWYNMIQQGQGPAAALELIKAFSQGTFPQDLMYLPGNPAYTNTWHQIIQAAEDANDPGTFTAFIGYEWTSNTGGNNLHRNVIFRDGGDLARQVVPLTVVGSGGSDDPRDLWTWLAAYEEKTGGNVLAIPHNGNLSNGLMFPLIEPVSGQPLDEAYARSRATWERVYEVTQMKGDGEAHPALSPNDEFAGYETWDKGNLDLSVPKKPEMLQYEYARAALLNGLALGAELGVNPFQFGMIGSTDAHTGLTAAEEDNFFSKVASEEPNPERMLKPFIKGSSGLSIFGWEIVAGGYAAVWATENTREAIFDAIERREVYATTGPRMSVRLFGGWDFVPEDVNTRSPGVEGYTRGVPMGGQLSKAPEGGAPRFLVAALRDPIGANLDRIQIVKGWMDATGALQQKVYDVAWSGGRTPDAQGKLPAVGNTVDVVNATWTNTIGAPELITVWQDPDFDPAERAFYYARVMEIPTPRWTAYDAKYYGTANIPPEVPMVHQERAYTSPIWYNPT
ncbi:DUF3604 domain-containing protein [Paracoccus benzoatiresistens]|uniref:DUF3604 domain-containing protein n=1 Tax=Paracoccus benzoatiresistens TaxID=2997341 RepID=A0ABT4J6W8_9RHOB|nr:DUF3604 domain-containing protein [Paracoccus sp. EF6]MCZ0962352.1 DUF3604 domain-containing protein [Paracoccus sp. EF6]